MVQHPAGYGISSPLLLFEKIYGEAAIAFTENRTLGIRNEYSFRGHVPTARTLAYLCFASLVTETVARLATGSGGLTPRRAGFAPAGQKTKFHGVIAQPPIPIDQQSLVALIFLFAKTSYRGELPADLTPSLEELSRLQEQRESLALQMAETESRLAALSTDDVSPDARLLQLRAELNEELAIHTEKHPNVVSLRRQIAGLEREIAEIDAGDTDSTQRNNTPLAASRTTLEELKRQRDAAEVRILDLEQRVARIPERQEELEALEEKESVLQATYIDFLRKVQEAELAQTLEQAQQGARISVIERAEPPLHPTRSRRKLLAVAVLASLLAACGAGILFELMDPVLLMSSDAHSVEDIPILGSVPWIT